MVTEYHLNLGPKDTLEAVVNLIKQKYPELKSSEKKTAIEKAEREYNEFRRRELANLKSDYDIFMADIRRIEEQTPEYNREKTA